MNILYLTNHLNIGGITSYVLSLSKGMKERGHTVYVASSAGKLAGSFTESGITFIPVPILTKKALSPKILFSFLKLSELIKKGLCLDIIHSNSRTTQVLGCILTKRFGITHLSTCHGFFRSGLLRKKFSCWGDKVIAISDAVKEHLIRDFSIDERKITLVNSGIDAEKFQIPNSKSQAERKKGLGLADAPVIGIIARLSEEKGHIHLIEAMKIVNEAFPSAQLLIAGEGRMEKELVSLTKRLGLDKCVFFLPFISDTREVLFALDIFVLPSTKEGLGLSLMEAMSSGLAVIGSDVGGIKSLLRQGLNGLLVSPQDPKQLAEAMIELLRDEGKRKLLGQNASQFIREKFSLKSMVLKTEEAYLECLNSRK